MPDAAPAAQGVYKPRRPQASPLFRLVSDHLHRLQTVYDERFARAYGPWRPVIGDVADKFLACGVLEHGFARIRCDACTHEYLLAFSCKCRYFCPSCHAKRLAIWTQWLDTTLLAPVPPRQVVLTIPKRLRAYCLYRRRLLGEIARVAARTVTAAIRTLTGERDLAVGIVACLQTHGSRANWHPHLHLLVTAGGFRPDGTFVTWPVQDTARLNGRLRAFDPATGESRWSTVLPSETWASPVVDRGVLFLGSDDGFYALMSGAGTSFHRAVFWDSTYVAAGWHQDHEWLADELELLAWDRLDAQRLERWLRDRVADGEPSALIMALDRLPDAIRAGGPTSLFRQYLDAGGTVVWPGLLPGLWVRNLDDGADGGLAAVTWDSASAILGVDVGAATFDHIGTTSRPAGIALGLPDRWLSHWTVDPQPSLEPLAVDENGRYAAWRRNYGGPAGTGFVRVWSSRRALRDPVPFVTAAELRPMDPDS